MTRFTLLFGSSIGRKILMAVTGVLLIGFAVGHLAGNLLVFRDADVINGYAHFLHAQGPLLWAARILLLVCLGIHVWAAVALALENRRARGSQPAKTTWLEATFESRTMQLTGAVVVAFLGYHLAHFTFGAAQASSFKGNIVPYVMKTDFHLLGFQAVRAGEEVSDVHTMIVEGFKRPSVSLFYVLAVGLLSLHLLHGIESSFQSFGWGHAIWRRRVRRIGAIFCLLYFLANSAIPAGSLSGFLRRHPDRAVASELGMAAAAEK